MDEPTEALWGLTVDVSDDEEAKARQEKKERREKRMRAAFEEARKTYKAKLDTNAWFLEHVSMDEHTPVSEFDAKASQRLQSSILYMYMKKEFSQAYEWAYSYLCKVHVLGSDVILGEHNLPVFAAPPASTKQEKSLANSAMTKEVLDIALRCILHAPMTDGVDRCLAAAFERVRLPSKDYLALFVDNEVVESAVKQCNWTLVPGLAMSLGDVCLHLSHPQWALEAYALVMGVRGPNWRVCVAVARCLACLANDVQGTDRVVCKLYAQAAAACALLTCTFTQRIPLARDMKSGSILGTCMPTSSESYSMDMEEQWVHCPSMISREAVIAISLALRKRGGVYYLATKFPAYLETISQYLQDTSMPWFALEGDTTTEAAPRSVRTL